MEIPDVVYAVLAVLFAGSGCSLCGPTRSYEVWRGSNLTDPQYSGTHYPITTRTGYRYIHSQLFLVYAGTRFPWNLFSSLIYNLKTSCRSILRTLPL